jgi:uncharacterized membrane protein
MIMARSLASPLSAWSFDTLNLNRVYLRVFADNPRAIRCYEKVGYQHEGRLRQHDLLCPLHRGADGQLHRYAVSIGGREVRFIALEIAPGRAVAAFDGCVICGAEGYVQVGAEILCRHCHSAIYPPSIGQPGGCNPIPVAFSVEGGRLVLSMAALAGQARMFDGGASSHH